MVTEKSQKMSKKFYCECCNYSCSNKFDFNKHLLTRKHEKFAISDSLVTFGDIICDKIANPEIFACKTCNKVYKSRNGLWCHQKKCEQNSAENVEETPTNLSKDDIKELLKQNQEFKELIIDQNNKLFELAKEGRVIHNTTNNTTNNFNLNMFLNEKCKDALNIADFVNSLKLELTDLENTGRLGYVEGISRIIIRGLKELDVYKRPIHCSDVKRETMYIKDNNSWEKDDEEKKKLTKAIKHISVRNAKQVGEWTKENVGYNIASNKKSDTYLKIISEANGGEKEEINKIIKNISTEVKIDKT
jgi:uncharacterized protein YxeA